MRANRPRSSSGALFPRARAARCAGAVSALALASGCSASPGVEVTRDAGRVALRDARADAAGDARDGALADGRGPDGDARKPLADGRGHDDALRTDDAARDVREASIHDAGADRAVDAGPPGTSIVLSLPLSPPFATAIHDYTVRCTAEQNTILVTMTAAPGAAIALAQPIATTPAPEGQASVTVAAGGAIVVDVLADGGTDPYWIRCLPPSFPEIQATFFPDAGTPTPGYYLLGNTTSAMGGSGYAMLLDTHGVPVWFTSPANSIGVLDVDNLVPDTVSYLPNVSVGGPPGFTLQDLVSGAVSQVSTIGEQVDFHELRVLPNGDYLMLADPVQTGVDLTGLQSFGANENVIDCEIQEVTPAGVVAWDWHASDHFDPVQDATFPTEQATLDGPGVSPYHCNAIDVAANGDLLVSARAMDSVFRVAKGSGAVVWKMGGATFTKDGAAYLAVTGDPLTQFRRQHDARFVAGSSETQVSLFDDQTSLPGPARAVIYTLDLAAGTATLSWQYRGIGASDDMGSFRTSEDGSRVVGWGFSSRAPSTFTEIGTTNRAIFDFTFVDGSATYRALKLPTSAFDLDLLRRTTGG